MCECNTKQARLDNMSDAKVIGEKVTLNALEGALNGAKMNVIGVMGFIRDGKEYKLFEADLKEQGTLYACVRREVGRDDTVCFAYQLENASFGERMRAGRAISEIVTNEGGSPMQLRMNQHVPGYVNLKPIVEGAKFVDVRKRNNQTKIDDFDVKRPVAHKGSFANRMKNEYGKKVVKHDNIVEEIIREYTDALHNGKSKSFDQYYKNKKEEKVPDYVKNFDFKEGCVMSNVQKHVLLADHCEVVLIDDGDVCTVTFKRRQPDVELTFDDLCYYLKRIERDWK